MDDERDDKAAALALWAAVLLQAIKDAYGEGWIGNAWYQDNHAVTLSEQAVAWMKSSRYGPGSFLWICDLMGLTPGLVRRRVLEDVRHVLHPRNGGEGRRRWYSMATAH